MQNVGRELYSCMDKDGWQSIFNSVRTNCKQPKLRECNFKFLHRLIVSKRELFRFGIKPDNEWLYCGKPDSTDHSFIHCHFTKHLINNIIQGFNEVNKCNFKPGMSKTFFGLEENLWDNKFNCILLLMSNLIFTSV